MFNSYPQQFSTDESKVFFAISHMKKMALEWFEQGIMDCDLLHTPVWCSSWKDFLIELHTNFGPANPIGMAEAELHHLCMNHEVCLTDYLVWFNTLTAHVGWGEGALCFQFYNGLPDQLKDKITLLGKPNTLCKLVQVTQCYDNLYWEERKFTHRQDFRPPTSSPHSSDP